MISKSGENLSNGEKQIINFLRIMLHETKCVFLDEATSNLDPITDQIINKYILEFCKNKTLIVITHKVESLYLYDRVVLMESGKVIETINPKTLLSDKTSRLFKYINECKK